MLDRTARDITAQARPASRIARLLRRIRRTASTVLGRSFSSLTRRIVLLNLLGLLLLAGGVLWQQQFRTGLIDSRIQSLLVQSEIMAGAIAASATADSAIFPIDPDRLFELQLGDTTNGQDDPAALFEFPINPERVAPILRRLTGPTQTQARIYDREGNILLDSRAMFGRGDIMRFDLPPPDMHVPFYEKWWNEVTRFLRGGTGFPIYRDLGPANGRGYPELVTALGGQKASAVRVNERGEIVVTVAAPIQRFRGVLGVLLLNTQGGEIDAVLDAERMQVFRVVLVLGIVMILLSILMARTIAEPVHRLAAAADRVRRRIKSREEIPDFTHRRDEIGHLSGALREMTGALYARIEAIERFAADVAHELKNPLTSLRSAVETLPIARTDSARARLLEVIQHDVKRLDRLISDISDASRLDAELQRQETRPVDLRALLGTLVMAANETRGPGRVPVILTFETRGTSDYVVPGHDSRLGQVVANLIDNAISFSPPTGTVRVTVRRAKLPQGAMVEIVVDDDGPGIRPDALDRIFERFYTDRPHQDYGQNSGLGLSISRQIVEAHGGRIAAENRTEPSEGDGGPSVKGARFTVRLPAN